VKGRKEKGRKRKTYQKKEKVKKGSFSLLLTVMDSIYLGVGVGRGF